MNAWKNRPTLILIKKLENYYGLYQCSCGNTKKILISNVEKGKTYSCGCFRGDWSTEQESYLKSNFPDFEKISKEIKKPISAIRDKAKKMKLFISPKISIWYESVPIEVRAYLAGHFDGEGCASFRKRKHIRAPVLSLSICHRPALELYKKYFNGNIDKGRTYIDKRKTIYRWKLVGYEDMYNFILAIVPFSLEKKEQLLLLKEYIDVFLKNGKKVGFDESFKDLSIQLHLKCTELKRTA